MFYYFNGRRKSHWLPQSQSCTAESTFQRGIHLTHPPPLMKKTMAAVDWPFGLSAWQTLCFRTKGAEDCRSRNSGVLGFVFLFPFSIPLLFTQHSQKPHPLLKCQRVVFLVAAAPGTCWGVFHICSHKRLIG